MRARSQDDQAHPCYDGEAAIRCRHFNDKKAKPFDLTSLFVLVERLAFVVVLFHKRFVGFLGVWRYAILVANEYR